MPAPAARTVLSLDFGLRRIGAAVGNTLTGTAEPLATINARGGEPDWTALSRCIADWQPAAIIVGVPYNDDGSRGALAPAALEFAASVGRRYGIAVHAVDEHLSSREAEAGLRDRRRGGQLARRVRRGEVDREAARLLLLQWLRAQQD